jgi:hypothetical protein
MRLKLTMQQCAALHDMFRDRVINEKPEDIAESLILDHMHDIFKKLRAKVEAKKPDGYSITMSDKEAKAYWVYFNQRAMRPNYGYEANMIQQHINLIDKTYA